MSIGSHLFDKIKPFIKQDEGTCLFSPCRRRPSTNSRGQSHRPLCSRLPKLKVYNGEEGGVRKEKHLKNHFRLSVLLI